MEQFVTKDLYLASFLVSAGCLLDSHTRADGIVRFSFNRNHDLEELVASYFSMKASVNPIRYDEAIKSLRNLTLGPKRRQESTLLSQVAM